MQALSIAPPRGRIAPLEAQVGGGENVIQRQPATSTSPSASAGVIQRISWPWNWRWPWSRTAEPDRYEQLSESDRRIAHFTDAIHQQGQTYERQRAVVGGNAPSYDFADPSEIHGMRHAYNEFHSDAVTSAKVSTARTAAEKTRQVSSVAAKIGTLVTHLGQIEGNDALGDNGLIAGGTSAGVGALGSLVEAGMDIHDVATSEDKKKDKGLKTLSALGSLANATNSGASGVRQISGLVGMGGNIASAAATVAAPAAIAKGGAAVITGLATGGLAHYRSRRLQEIATSPSISGENEGIARFAGENQWLKAKTNYGRAAGGALTVLGGALLLAAGLSNPIGWALLAAGGLVGLGVGAYKMYKKHQQGKLLAQGTGTYAGLENIVPSEPELGSGGLADLFKTRSMRRRDVVRGRIGVKLAESEQRDSRFTPPETDTLNRIGRQLGVSRLDTQRLGLMMDAQEVKKARSKAYARALNY